MKIYTKKGDKGKTFLADGTRHEKSEEIFWLLGEVDELCAQIGFSISVNRYISKSVKQYDSKIVDEKNLIIENLKRIQRDLFTINSILARAKNIKFDAEKETELLEKEIDKMTAELPELKNFILPGGSELSANFHVARAICRRVERRLTQGNLKEFISYFNRLSDYLFTLARFVNFKMGEKEEIWKG